MSTPEVPNRVLRTVDAQFGVVTLAATALHLLVASVQATAFWFAAVLPFTYIPLLATGLVGDYPVAFLALVTVNAVGFVLGRGYKTGSD
jgi:uncharacterized membrane protein (Fun14 family)